MNWFLKMTAKIVISRIPIGYQFWQKMGLFRHGSMDNSEYSIRVFQSHINLNRSGTDIRGKVLLELGPGDSIATAIIAATYGAKAVLVDVGHYVKEDISTYHNLIATLKSKGLHPPVIENCKNITDILQVCEASYYTDGVNSLQLIPSESVDFIFSQAVLEHIWKHEFLPMMKECKRVLTKNGTASHRVDLRDHLGGALNSLRFSERVWESKFFVRSGFYTNRIRFHQMEQLFQEAGFKSEYPKIDRWEVLPTPVSKMDQSFQNLEDDLLVSGFNVIQYKFD